MFSRSKSPSLSGDYQRPWLAPMSPVRVPICSWIDVPFPLRKQSIRSSAGPYTRDSIPFRSVISRLNTRMGDKREPVPESHSLSCRWAFPLYHFRSWKGSHHRLPWMIWLCSWYVFGSMCHGVHTRRGRANQRDSEISWRRKAGGNIQKHREIETLVQQMVVPV